MTYAMQNHDNVSVRLMADEIVLAYEAMISGDIKKTATLVRIASAFEKDFHVGNDGSIIVRLDISKIKKG